MERSKRLRRRVIEDMRLEKTPGLADRISRLEASVNVRLQEMQEELTRTSLLLDHEMDMAMYGISRLETSVNDRIQEMQDELTRTSLRMDNEMDMTMYWIHQWKLWPSRSRHKP